MNKKFISGFLLASMSLGAMPVYAAQDLSVTVDLEIEDEFGIDNLNSLKILSDAEEATSSDAEKEETGIVPLDDTYATRDLSFIDSETEELIEGISFIITDDYGEEIESITDNGDWTYTVTELIHGETYHIKITDTPENYTSNIGRSFYYTVGDSASSSWNVSLIKNAESIEVTLRFIDNDAYRADGTRLAVAGAVVSIEMNGEEYTFTADENGYITIPGVASGTEITYTLTDVLGNYIIGTYGAFTVGNKSPEHHDILLSTKEGEDNSAQAVIYITDTNGNPIEGAVITIAETGDSYTTDESGCAIITLGCGAIYTYSVEAPEGYEIPAASSSGSFYITSENTEKNIEVTIDEIPAAPEVLNIEITGEKIYDGTSSLSVENITYTATTEKEESVALDFSEAVITLIDKNVNYDSYDNVIGVEIASVSGVKYEGVNVENIYDAVFSGSCIVHPKEIYVSVIPEDKVYDNTRSSTLKAYSDDVISGDDLSISAFGLFEDAEAGKNKLINVTGISISGEDRTNYYVGDWDHEVYASITETSAEYTDMRVVIVDDDENPIAFLSVTVRVNGIEKIYTTDENGCISISNLIEGSEVVIIIDTENYYGEISFIAGEDKEITFTAKTKAENEENRTGTVVIHVVDKDNPNLGVADVEVIVNWTDYVSDSNGNITIIDLPYGEYDVRLLDGTSATLVVNNEMNSFTIEVTVTGSETVTEEKYVLTINPLNSNGNSISGIVVRIYDENGTLTGEYSENEDNKIITELKKGTYTVKITNANGYTFSTSEFEVVLSSDASLDIKASSSSSHRSSGGGGSSSSSSGWSSSTSAVYPDAASVSGTWTYYENIDKWTLNDFAYKNQWVYVYNPYATTEQGQYDWFHFDANGYMDTGWFMDVDGNIYYLNPVSDNTRGKMLTGWQEIDGKYYYFNEVSNGTQGAMYRNTVTPDGKYVDENGELIG